jgi:hypothetical protein
MTIVRYEASDCELTTCPCKSKETVKARLTKYEIGGVGLLALADISAEALFHIPYSVHERVILMVAGGIIGYGIRKLRERRALRRVEPDNTMNYHPY